ncbi:MAG: hypothetical protein JJT75_01590 [Opitutales bacterium]|nr:hypothetical protein [Opitutales bacterium]MCH8540016.1 hypothetical protein [Opitutales bacterium]
MAPETKDTFQISSLLPIGGACILLGIILSATIIGLPIGLPMLIVGFILAPIGLLAKSRQKSSFPGNGEPSG